MAFEASKREWSELYLFFKLLSDGEVYPGTADGKKAERPWPVALVAREEGVVTHYIIKEAEIVAENEQGKRVFPRQKFTDAAARILQAVKSASTDEVTSPDEVEAFLDELKIYSLEAQTNDRTDLSVAFWSTDAPLVGFSVCACLGKMKPLLDGGRAANLKFEVVGTKLPSPTVNKINAIESANEVIDRMFAIGQVGGSLKYADVADRVFRCNLAMIDLHFPRLLAEMLRTMYLNGTTRIADIVEEMKAANPLKIKDELIQKHCYYEYKVKQFLMALALGMRPAKIFNGADSAVEGMFWVDGSGEVLCYHKSDKKCFEEFLYLRTRFEKGATEKDKYGFLERENGNYFFKLNAKIGYAKR